MLIRSKIERIKPGVNPPEPVESFVVEFGLNRERKYEFKLDPASGEHTCDVQHRADAEALLKVVEGYEIHPKVLDAAESAMNKAAAKDRAEALAKAEAEAIERANADRRAAQEKTERDEADAKARAEAETKAKAEAAAKEAAGKGAHQHGGRGR